MLHDFTWALQKSSTKSFSASSAAQCSVARSSSCLGHQINAAGCPLWHQWCGPDQRCLDYPSQPFQSMSSRCTKKSFGIDQAIVKTPRRITDVKIDRAHASYKCSHFKLIKVQHKCLLNEVSSPCAKVCLLAADPSKHFKPIGMVRER